MKMKPRWIAAAVLAGLALVVTAGVALAASRPDTPVPGGSPAAAMTEECAAVHDSAAMRQLHAQMPAQQRAQCDALHAAMQQMHATMPRTHMAGPAGQHMIGSGMQQMMRTAGHGPAMMGTGR